MIPRFNNSPLRRIPASVPTQKDKLQAGIDRLIDDLLKMKGKRKLVIVFRKDRINLN